MSSRPGLLLSLLAYTLLSVGFVLEKKGIAWIGFKGRKDRVYFNNLFIWISGFLIANLYIVPNTMALKSLSPHVVASVAGWGVAVTVILSWAVLGERLYCADLLDTALIAGAIVAINLFEQGNAGDIIRVPYLVAASVLPFMLFALFILKAVTRGTRAVLLAAVSGISTGMITVAMKALVSLFGFRIGDYFVSPYLYLYLLFSITAFVTLQMAFKTGDMMLAGPAQYSMAIIYPVICSMLVFGSRFHPVQPAAILLVVIFVVRLLRRHWTPGRGLAAKGAGGAH